MRHLSWIVTIPLGLVVVVFALANRDEVTLEFWPFPWTASPPLFVVVLCCLLLGFLVGALLAWASAGPRRRRARQTAERARDLAAENAELKRRLEAEKQIAARAEAEAAAQPAAANRLEHLPGA